MDDELLGRQSAVAEARALYEMVGQAKKTGDAKVFADHQRRNKSSSMFGRQCDSRQTLRGILSAPQKQRGADNH